MLSRARWTCLIFILMNVFLQDAAFPSSINNKTQQTPAETPTATHDTVTTAISSNPAAVNVGTGTGVLQQYLEKKLGIHDNHGFAFQGAWLGDTNRLLAGGIPDAMISTANSVLLLNLAVDMERFINWSGGTFNVAFLQQNAQNTNGQAGVIQGYNSLPDVAPYIRGELYDLWYRQALLDNKLFVRVGKTITTLDFNNVIKPVPLNPGDPIIPAVTSLIYTPIFINPTVDGVMPGYTNSAYGITLNFTPIKTWYLTYGVYDGNLASGKQTGLTGPTFNGNYFHVAESGAAWMLGKNHLPGTMGIGAWHQTGLIQQSVNTEMGASGVYIFGSQRLWYQQPGISNKGISSFYQLGINNSSVLPMKKFIGGGLTAFGMVGNRADDSMGFGFALSGLNHLVLDRSAEVMYQIYYQAKIIQELYLEPAFSYIPNPGTSNQLSAVWAGTLRAIVLF